MDYVKYLYGAGNIDASVAFVGEAPGANEIKLGLPFVGAAGKKLDMFLSQIGLLRDDIYITNVIKYRPVKKSVKTGNFINRTPDVDEIKNAIPFLLAEMNFISPDLIVSLGNISLRALTCDFSLSISKAHGSIIASSNGFRLFPMFHPASVIYNNSILALYEEDIKKLRHELCCLRGVLK